MNKFAFIIHPLQLEDFYRKFSWAEKVPQKVLKKFTKVLPAVKASHITGIKSRTGEEIEGYFVSVTLTSEQMLDLPVKKVIKKIVKAGKKAQEMGVRIVGLGAFTSVVGDKGITIARKLDIPVTTGNSYTVATAIEATKLAALKMGHDIKEATLTVIGATGSIGRAVSLIMSRDIKKIMLVARNIERLEKLKEEIYRENPGIDVNISNNVSESISQSQLIVSASGAVKSLIEPGELLPGSVVCDVARPRDVAIRVGKERDDVLVIEGGIVEIPGTVNFNLDFGYPPGTAYACMAETMMLTLEKRFENFSLGPIIELEKVQETMIMAEKHGFKLAGLRSFERELNDNMIEEIKEKARKEMMAI